MNLHEQIYYDLLQLDESKILFAWCDHLVERGDRCAKLQQIFQLALFQVMWQRFTVEPMKNRQYRVLWQAKQNGNGSEWRRGSERWVEWEIHEWQRTASEWRRWILENDLWRRQSQFMFLVIFLLNWLWRGRRRLNGWEVENVLLGIILNTVEVWVWWWDLSALRIAKWRSQVVNGITRWRQAIEWIRNVINKIGREVERA